MHLLVHQSCVVHRRCGDRATEGCRTMQRHTDGGIPYHAATHGWRDVANRYRPDLGARSGSGRQHAQHDRARSAPRRPAASRRSDTNCTPSCLFSLRHRPVVGHHHAEPAELLAHHRAPVGSLASNTLWVGRAYSKRDWPQLLLFVISLGLSAMGLISWVR
jgi:hypothetical protein